MVDVVLTTEKLMVGKRIVKSTSARHDGTDNVDASEGCCVYEMVVSRV